MNKKNAIIILATNSYLPLGLRLISKIKKFYKDIDNLDIHLVADFDLSNKIKLDNIIMHSRSANTWDLSTMLKLDICLSIAANYDYEYIGCLDADTNIYRSFDESEIFAESFVMKHVSTGISAPSIHYEDNKKSSAYVPPSEYQEVYYQTCYFGGTKNKMTDMVKMAIDLRTLDLNRNIIAKWTDEGYLQKYFIANPPFIAFEPNDQNIFPFVANDKGSSIDKINTGKHYKPFQDITVDEYNTMLEKIYQLLSTNNDSWDIVEDKIV